MTFFVLFAATGLVLTLGTVYLAKRFKKEWKMPKRLYFKAGLSLIVIGIFHVAVLDGLLSYWTQFKDLDFVLQGIFLGIFSALFIELGRFFVLDKFFKGVRNFRESVYFGLGWNGVATFILGILMVVGTYGLYLLVSTEDVAGLYPEASSEELQQIVLYQEEAKEIVSDTPVMGILPVFERGAILLVDIFMTLIIILGFSSGTSSYVWYAILIRSGFNSISYISNEITPYLAMFFFIVVIAAGVYYLKEMKEMFPKTILPR